MATSGIRFKKLKLTAPIRPLKAKMTANCQPAGCCLSTNAEKTSERKLPNCTQAASSDKYRPRMVSGTSEVIQVSHALLEMPRDKLNANSNSSMSAISATLFRNEL